MDQWIGLISAPLGHNHKTYEYDAMNRVVSETNLLNHITAYAYDALHRMTSRTDADGAVVAHMIYDPFGRALLETYTDANFSGLDNLNNFTGYTWDETLGLYFAQNRFYDAVLHRFTQEDGVKDGGNWYAYCGNNPLVYVDPWGLRQVEDIYGTGGDSNNTASHISENQKKNRQETKQYSRVDLLRDLTASVNNYKNVFQTIATAPYNSTEEALEIVLSYNQKIECTAKKYSIDMAMIQAILFQEIRFLNILDEEADMLVLQTYQHYQEAEEYASLPWPIKLFRGVSSIPAFARTDSSTGLGQIFAKTAIIAYNDYYDTAYDPFDWKDLREFWLALKYDNEFNIDMVGLILAYEQSKLSLPTPQRIMQAYNGTGDLAQKYGEVTNQYYEAFRKYNAAN